MHAKSAFTSVTLSVIALFAPGCAAEDDVDARALLTGGNSGGGTVFNTNVLDEREFSEVAPLDTPHMGWALDQWTLADATEVAEVLVDAGELVAVDADGARHRGAALVGSVWRVGYAMGLRQVPVRLGEVLEHDGVPHYRFFEHTDDGAVSTCPSGPDGPGRARVLADLRVDESTGAVHAAPRFLHLACDTGATGKVAALGYHDVALANDDLALFEVGIRALRADYCYDGASHTEPGVAFLLADVWGLRAASDEEAKRPVEAVWGRDGLLCAGEGRKTDIACEEPAPPCEHPVNFASYPDALYITRLP